MKVVNDFDLTNFNSYRLSSTCKRAYFPETEIEVISLFSSREPFILLGSGHNVILSKRYYDSNFIIFNGNFNKVQVDADSALIEAEAGISMFEMSKLALDNSLTGLEIFYDIPSSLGGAVVMNAGASGEEIKDVINKVRYLDLEDLTVKEIINEDMGFEYRNSFFQRNMDKVILKVVLQLSVGERNLIKEKMLSVRLKRWEKQPKEFPNAGSVFKRPPKYYVGAMIDELGLKGYAVGGAKISEKHGGFIVNFNQATGADILSIIKEVQSRVMDKFGIELEVEQRII